MQINGYVLRYKSNSSEIARWGAIPVKLDLPNGDIVFGADVNYQHPLYKIEALSWTEVDPIPPTPDELYDLYLQQQNLLKAIVLCLNDGTLPVGQNLTGPQIKAIVKVRI